MTKRKPHKWAEVIKAWADGKPIQYKPNKGSCWIDYDPEYARQHRINLDFYSSDVPKFDEYEWRVKPEAIVVENYIWLDSSCNETRLSVSSSPNTRFTFDPDTKSLIKAEVIR